MSAYGDQPPGPEDVEFLQELAESCPDIDWDHLPGLEDAPDVFVVKGMKITTNRRGNDFSCDFQVDAEYKTREEAEAQLKRCETWSGVILASLNVSTEKPSSLVYLHLAKAFRDDILAGRKVFLLEWP